MARKPWITGYKNRYRAKRVKGSKITRAMRSVGAYSSHTGRSVKKKTNYGKVTSNQHKYGYRRGGGRYGWYKGAR